MDSEIKNFPRIIFLRLSLFKPSWVVVDVTLVIHFLYPRGCGHICPNFFCVPYLGCGLVVTFSFLEAAHKITKTFKLCPWKIIAYLKNKVKKNQKTFSV